MEKKAQKLWTLPFVSVILVGFFTSSCCYGLSNGTPLYISSIGGAAALSGLLNTGFGTASAVARLFSGALSDRVGRRRIMLAGSALFTVSAALPAIVGGGAALMFARVLNGISFAFVMTAASAAAADVVPEERMGEGLGYFGLSQSLAIAFGPTIAIALYQLGGKWLFWGEAAVVSLGLVFSCFFRADRTAPAPRRAPLVLEEEKAFFLWKLLEKRVLWPAVMFFLFSFSCAVLISFAALYAQDQGYRHSGLFYAVQAGTMILVRLTAGRLIDRFSSRAVLFPTVLCGVLAFLALTLSRNEMVFYACGVLYGLCVGLMFPLLLSFSVRRAPQERTGAVNATLYLFSDAGYAAGVFVWGAVIDSAAGYPASFIGGAAGLALILGIGVFALRERPETLDARQAES